MDDSHLTSDLQSLRLTQAAVDALVRQPELIAAVMHTLAHWDEVASPHSKPLRDEWRSIIDQRQWHRALAISDHAQQLRQASPLGKALTPAVRLTIIRECKGHNSST